MKIGYISETNPFVDRYSWSGLIFKIREAIENAGFTVVWIPFRTDSSLVKFSEKIRWKLYRLCGKKIILGGVHFLPEVYGYATSIEINDDFASCDLLFFPRGGQIGLFLKTEKPIVYYSDATTFLMVDYYWKNCSPLSVKVACYIEKMSARKAALNLRSSQWAINSVVNDCKCDINCCYVLEFGANIDDNDITPIKPYRSGQLNVLFSGVEWERKGGDIAVETVRNLRKRGVDAILHIVGIKELPDYCKDCDFIVFHGFLNKNNKDSYRNYINIFANSHIMLLPTKAECSATVYSEAAAFGIPTYTYATGGTENYVINGINGHAIPLELGASDFSDLIFNDIKYNKMSELHNRALKLYLDKLSWSAWSKRFNSIIDNYFNKE